jgi:hypothetical protein
VKRGDVLTGFPGSNIEAAPTGGDAVGGAGENLGAAAQRRGGGQSPSPTSPIDQTEQVLALGLVIAGVARRRGEGVVAPQRWTMKSSSKRRGAPCSA